MESGFYRCADSSVNMSDWIRLNFDAFQATILHTMMEDSPEIMEDLIRLDLQEEPEAPSEPCPFAQDEEPVRAEFDTGAEFVYGHAEWKEGLEEYQEYEAAHTKWEEEYAEWEGAQQLMGWPVAWNTMWAARDTPDLVEALSASGFVVYRTQSELEDFGPIIFGVDGCGYGFYGAHWIPLRAALARNQYDSGYLSGEDFAATLAGLVPQVESEGDDPKLFLVAYGNGVPEMGALDCVIGWELHKELGLGAKV